MTELDRPKMTHDEMIDTLKGLVFGTFDRTTAREREALDEAIKVLENKLVVGNATDEDLISRKALYEALYEHFHDEDAPNNITEITLGSVRNFLKDFPSVAPTHKKGHWIKQENTKTTDLYRCSICGRSIILCKGAFLKDYPYCHCGAEMQGVEE